MSKYLDEKGLKKLLERIKIPINGSGSGACGCESLTEEDIIEVIDLCLENEEIEPEPPIPDEPTNYINAQINGLESTNGLTNGNTTRISTDYFKVDPSTNIIIESLDDYLIIAYQFSPGKSKVSTALGNFTSSSISSTTYTSASFIRILLKKADDSEFTETELLNAKIKINDKVYGLQNKTLVYDLDYVIAGLSSSNGNEMTATNRLSTDFIELSTEYSTKCYIRTLATQTFVIRGYDENKVFTSTVLTNWTSKNGEFDIPSNCKYIRMSFKNSTDSNLTELSTDRIMVQGIEYKLKLKS